MTAYVGEIRLFAGNFAPAGWLFCAGQTVPISENEVLFQLIGTTYGGDGEETFQLPNLQSRVPVHMGTGPSGTTYQIGQLAGSESITLSTQQIPIHSHPFTGSTSNGTATNPGNAVLAGSLSSVQPLVQDSVTDAMAAGAIGPAGGSQPHENLQPYLCINFIISMFGVFPSQT
jgi:microcystin-dependent protein